VITRAASCLACIALALACARGQLAAPANVADAGIAIAVYRAGDRAGYAVVDDRRWVELDGASLVLDHIDPRAALSSLVIEAVDAQRALEVGACTRDRIPSLAAPAFVPILRCAVTGARGRRLVRVLYIVPALDYRVSHDVAMTAADRATVTSRFAIDTPAWQRRAELALYDGVPGAQQPPREIARGPIALDGGVAMLASPPRVATAQLRRIYDGAVHRRGDVGPRDLRWRRESHPSVWVWLELADIALAPGPVRVHVELAGHPIRDIDVPALGRRTVADALALPLWIDDELRGRRDRWSQPHDGAAIVDRFAIAVTNLGATASDVWIEEALRPSRRRTVRHAWPATPVLLEARVRMKLTVAPGKIERCGFEIDYELQGPRDR
jgi:hypothetical protein